MWSDYSKPWTGRWGRSLRWSTTPASWIGRCAWKRSTLPASTVSFATNITGAFLCAREAVRRMSTKHGGGGGAIVNVSSAASRLGSPGEYVDYAASKGAIDAMTLGLSKEVAAEAHTRERGSPRLHLHGNARQRR